MLQNAYFLAKIVADTAENEQHFAEILPKTRRDPPRGHDEGLEEDHRLRPAACAPHRGGDGGGAGCDHLASGLSLRTRVCRPNFSKKTLTNAFEM